MKLYQHQKQRSERVRTRRERFKDACPLALWGGFVLRKGKLGPAVKVTRYIGFDRYDGARA
jgi:hypothetical protein